MAQLIVLVIYGHDSISSVWGALVLCNPVSPFSAACVRKFKGSAWIRYNPSVDFHSVEVGLELRP